MAPKDRWNLRSIPQLLKKDTLNHLFAFQAYQSKLCSKKKLKWLLTNGFQAEKSVFRNGNEKVLTIIEEDKQKEIYVAQFTKKIEYINKDVESAKKKADETFETLKKEYDKYYVGVCHYTFSLPSDDVMMDDGNDFFDEAIGEYHNKRRAIQNVAIAKQVTVTGFERKYQGWEEWQARRTVEKNAEISNKKVKDQVDNALKEHASQTSEMQQKALAEQKIMNEGVEILMNAMGLVMPNMVDPKNTSGRRKDTTRDAAGDNKTKKKREAKRSSSASSASTGSTKSSASHKRKRESAGNKGPKKKKPMNPRRRPRRENPNGGDKKDGKSKR